MRIKNGFILRKISDTYVVVAVGEAAENFNGMISLNETGGFMWQAIADGKSEQEIVDAIMAEYEVDIETAKADVAGFIQKMVDAGFMQD